MLLFAPRWLVLLPLVVLVPWALAHHRRSLWILITAACIDFLVIMDLCIPWNRFAAANGLAPSIRILTCNIHHDALDAARFAQLIAELHPDIVALQEWTPAFRAEIFPGAGWYFTTRGELSIASRFPIHHTREDAGDVHCAIKTPLGPVEFYCVHLASPHLALRDAAHFRDDGWLRLEQNILDRKNEVADLVQSARGVSVPVLLAGDFNLPSDSAIYIEYLSPYPDAFAYAGVGFGWSYHSRWTVARIDHILTDTRLECRRCWLGPDVGSPHRPLIADFRQADTK